MISKTFCAAPWTVHCINADGTTGVCCVNNTGLTQTRDHYSFNQSAAIKKLKADMLQGQTASGCEKCYDTEAAGLYSLRNHYNDATSHLLDMDRLRDDGYENRTWYDLSLGNKCNQKCRICGPYNSTAWTKDAKAVQDLEWTHVNWRQLDAASIDSAGAIPHILQSMKAARDPFTVELKGGEPLLMESSRQLLGDMIRHGLHEKTAELRIITNGTVHDDQLMSMLGEFPRIDMAISVDATGKLHEYTRGSNISWDDCRRSWSRLRGLPNLSRMRISNTIYAYTAFNLADLRVWVRSEFGADTSMADAMLHKPRYLHVNILPQHLRLQAADLLTTSDRMQAIISRDRDIGDMVKLHDQFRQYTLRLDRLRGENLVNLVPELAVMMS